MHREPEILEPVRPEIEIVATQLRFPEGPIAMGDGSVVVVEIGGKALTRVSAEGEAIEIARLDGGPNGAAMGPGDWCYVCNSGGWIHAEYAPGLRRAVGQSETPGWIERVHLRTGVVERLCEAVSGRRLQAPNDLVFDSSGGFYFTDHGKRLAGRLDLGVVYYASSDGARVMPVLSELTTPNGIGLSPDERTLYVAETATRCVWAFDLDAPGEVRARPFPPSSNGGRLLAGLPGYNRLDSMAVDSGGHVCVASLVNGGVWDIAGDGSAMRHYLIDDHFTTNVCFGGADLRSAYVTMSASGRLGRFRWPRPGLAPYFSGSF
jgi:gluconolactonase